MSTPEASSVKRDRVAVSVLTATGGDQAYNTYSGLSCGVGPVVCNGTNWKHLYTGATY